VFVRMLASVSVCVLAYLRKSARVCVRQLVLVCLRQSTRVSVRICVKVCVCVLQKKEGWLNKLERVCSCVYLVSERESVCVCVCVSVRIRVKVCVCFLLVRQKHKCQN